jgi:hypothetical protein
MSKTRRCLEFIRKVWVMRGVTSGRVGEDSADTKDETKDKDENCGDSDDEGEGDLGR